MTPETPNTTGDVTGRDKIIHGDEVHGDKVLGDKIIYASPSPRIPLQRPPRATHFQDRKDDLAQLLLDLQPGHVVTLCGPGGIGKTALAAEAIWTLAPSEEPSTRFPAGIIFHSFYNQPQAALALENIARTFGEEPKPTPKEAAQRALAGRRALLILDGTEEADDLRQVVDIRDQCAVLITSRTRNDEIEKRTDLSPLPLEDAVILLQAWAGARANNPTDARQIAELVGRLPLALRLVGRYLAQNEENAGDYLTWLAKTPLTALNQGNRREQSVPLLLARSLQQVSQRARQTLGIVGVLALAPFTHQPIAAALELSAPETRQAIGELVNYGLLLRPTEAYEVSHALVHTYARQQLAPSAEIVVKLATYHQQAIEEHPNDFTHLKTLHPHVMALLRTASERKTWEIVSSLAWSIEDYLDLQGYWSDLVLIIQTAITAAQAMQNRQSEGAWLGNLGNAYAILGQMERAIEYQRLSLKVARESGNRSGESASLGNLGSSYASLGKMKEAIAYHHQALTIDEEIGDRNGVAIRLGNLGNAYAELGHMDVAINYMIQAMKVHHELGNTRHIGAWLGNLGLVTYSAGLVEEAIGYHEQALAIAKEIGDRRGESIHLGNLGLAFYSLGQLQKSIDFYYQSLTIAQTIEEKGQIGNLLGNLGSAYHSLGHLQSAIAFHLQALNIHRQIGDRRDEAISLGNLGLTYADQGQVAQAIEHYQQALVIAREIGDRRNEGNWLGNLGVAYAAQGQVAQAIEHYQQALIIAREIGDRRGEGNHLGNLGIAYRNLGQVEQARQHYEKSLYIFEEIKSPNSETVRQWLSSLQNN